MVTRLGVMQSLLPASGSGWTEVLENDIPGGNGIISVEKCIVTNRDRARTSTVDIRVRIGGAAAANNDDSKNLVTDFELRPSDGEGGFWDVRDIVGLLLGDGDVLEIRSQRAASVHLSYILDNTAGMPSTPPEASRPSAPNRPTIVAGNGSLRVSWTAPSAGSSPTLGYNLDYRAVGGEWTTVTPIAGLSYEIRGLTNGTTYEVRVAAFNSAGAGQWSPIARGTPAAAPMTTAPSAPSAPSLTAGNAVLGVTWDAPADGGAAITDYDVRYKLSPASSWSDWAHTGTERSATITGLTNGSAYDVQVRATNSVGSSGWSPTATETPTVALAVPGPVRNAVATPGDGQLVVTWNAPNTGGAVASYDLRYTPAGGSAVTLSNLTTRSRTITGLANGTEVTIVLWARNATGTSPAVTLRATPTVLPVAAAPAVTIAAVPDGEEGTTHDLAATLAGGTYDTVDYAWTVDFGSLDDAAAASPTWTRPSVSSDTTVTITLTVTARGTGTVAQAGTSDTDTDTETTTVTANVPLVAPGPVTGLRATSRDGEVLLTWGAPTTGGQVVNYRVEWPAGWTSGRNTNQSAISIDGLTNGTAYRFRVRAQNSAGNSPWTEITGTPRAATTIPTIVQGFTATPSGTTELDLAWMAPASDGGAAITAYGIRYRVTGGDWVPDAAAPDARTYVIAGLMPATTYDIEIWAINTNGAGPTATTTATTGSPPSGTGIPLEVNSIPLEVNGIPLTVNSP